MILIILNIILIVLAFSGGYLWAVSRYCNHVSDILVGANNMLRNEHLSKDSCLLFMGRLHNSLNGISRYQIGNAKTELISYLASDELHGEELEIIST